MTGPGRPTLYTPELGEAICAEIADGVSLRKIAAMPGMPAKRTICYWLVAEDEKLKPFQQAYMIANRARAHGMADEILEISDASENDVDEEGKVNHNNIQRDKLRTDSRKWLAGKFLPDQFGDRVNVGGVADRPIETKDVSRNEIARRVAFLLMGRGEAK